MASKLNVEELRNQLAQRGLPTTGAKPTLVRRLDSALREEKKQPTGASDGSAAEASLVSRKREGKLIEEEGGGESTVSEKMKATEKFSGMSVKQLREEAALCGVSATGSKKELLERLSKHSDGIPLGKANEEGNGSKEKIVNATKKGMTVLDQWLPDDIKADYHVLQLGDDIYDAMLNQANVVLNNNKFYLIQVLESEVGGSFMIYYRCGRVGFKGQNKLAPHASCESAIKEFKQKFRDKTGNDWSNRKMFQLIPSCYMWIEMDYNEKEEQSAVSIHNSWSMFVEEKNGSALGRQPLETQLEPCIANFISLIFNIDMMKPHVMEIDNFVIDTPQKLKHKLEMVEALGEIEVATKLLKDDTGRQGDPLYSCYRRLHCELTPVGADSHEFDMITKYMRNTHAKTHSTYTVDIVQIFRTSKEGEVERFRKFSSTKNRMLLWHGSRLTNWVGILSQGLLITPPEAPVTGHMFGKGVYFADMFSKSAKYCHGCTSGVLLLCEVALGDMAELLTAKYDADKLPVGKLSTKGVGGTEPDFSEAQLLDDGVVVPLGKQKENTSHEGSLRYNEYIVYNVEQIRMRYVVQVNFNFKND
nr:poly [ADP-ribose] polymerase 2-like isoform X11 [Malus domestica]